MDFLNHLNPKQLQAVTQTDGAMLILAGAGSGKTRVITYKIAYLIERKLAKPEEILALTFTNKAAQEMKERASNLLAAEMKPPLISTFHALGTRLLRMHIDKLKQSRTNNFTIYDEADQVSLLKDCLQELGSDAKSFKLSSLRSKISNIKMNLTQKEDSKSMSSFLPQIKNIIEIYQLYQKKLQHYNALDFDDLLLKTFELLNKVKNIRDYYQEKFLYVLVDEFQDTNQLQYSILKILVDRWKNICVVGDDDQSIYRWRGANIGNMLNFGKDFPGCKEIKLQQNYRSTKNILNVANEVIAKNTLRKDKNLWTEREEGERAWVYQIEDEDEEARIVVDKIVALKREYHLQEIAVLYRTNFQSRPFEQALQRLHLPYKMVGSIRFFERKEIKDILSYLVLAAEPTDHVSLKRIINVPPRGIGAKTVSKLEEYAEEHNLSLWEAISADIKGIRLTQSTKGSLRSLQTLIEKLRSKADKLPASRLLRIIIEETDYLATFSSENEKNQQNRLENLKELIAAAKNYEEREEGASIQGFLDQVHLTTDQDYYNDAPTVSLMTLHCAKGLEFSVVFLVGMVEGLFPHRLCMKDPELLEEERRLCYVGMTRAKDKLFISTYLRRREYDTYRYCSPSRFLDDIPSHLIERKDIYDTQEVDAASRGEIYESIGNIQNFFEVDEFKTDIKGVADKDAEANGLVEGCQVVHPKYGKGVLFARSGSGDSAKVSVYFPQVGKKKFLLKYAPLKKA
jgi:DNA helicase-2/ATP-dependent DNA helicase PcrA